MQSLQIGASDERLQSFRANNLCHVRSDKVLAREGLKLCTSGRTERGKSRPAAFQTFWGATEEEISYARFEMAAGFGSIRAAVARHFTNTYFRALPASLNKLAWCYNIPASRLMHFLP